MIYFDFSSQDAQDVDKHRRHNDNDDETSSDMCEHPTAPYQCELFMLNIDNARTPLRVTTVETYRFYYSKCSIDTTGLFKCIQ